MHRVIDIKRAGQWSAASATDRVILDAGDRNRRRAVLSGERGTALMFDWPRPVILRNGDGLVLEDGGIVQVIGEPEPLVEIAARSALAMVQLAWHLGNRHTDVQICGECLRIRRDHVLEQMAEGLGASITPLMAPFDPEAAAPSEHGVERSP